MVCVWCVCRLNCEAVLFVFVADDDMAFSMCICYYISHVIRGNFEINLGKFVLSTYIIYDKF